MAQKEMLSMKHRIIPIIYKNVNHVTTLGKKLFVGKEVFLQSIGYLKCWELQSILKGDSTTFER